MASPKAAIPEWASNAALIVPLLLVNTVATYGQVQWAHDHLTPESPYWYVAVGFALAVESIGVYLAAEAHRALLAGDASLRLRLGSYGVGVLAGILNYAHFAPAMDTPNAQAIVFGVLSAISPVLWAIRSRSISRKRLRALNLIDGRAVKFTAAQWMLYPRSSFRAFRAAVWAGETSPAKARALVSTDPAPVRLTVVHLAGTFRPEPSALPGDLGVVAAVGPRRKEVTARPKPVAITDGRQRLRPDQHPLWPEWLEAFRSEDPWNDFAFARKLGSDVSMAAARSRRQRWERAAVEFSAPVDKS